MTQDNLLNLGGERSNRPNRLGNGTLSADQQTVDRFFDTSAFQVLPPTAGTVGFVPNQPFGNSGVGVLRGPNLINIDFNLSPFSFALSFSTLSTAQILVFPVFASARDSVRLSTPSPRQALSSLL